MRRLGLCLLVVFGLAATASAEPPTTHEVIYNRPSGFWTSNRPAVGGAYRYRMLGVGLVVLMGMGFVTWRVVRKANRDRAQRSS